MFSKKLKILAKRKNKTGSYMNWYVVDAGSVLISMPEVKLLCFCADGKKHKENNPLILSTVVHYCMNI